MKKLNQNMKRRDFILDLFFTDKEYVGGCRSFDQLDAVTLHTLIQEGFADGTEHQNLSPSIDAFLQFMVEHPNYSAHGYAVHKDRLDYRITLEGLEAEQATEQDMEEFLQFSSQADDRSGLYSWYD